MAPARARLLLVCAGLLAATAAGLAPGDPGAPAGSRARRELPTGTPGRRARRGTPGPPEPTSQGVSSMSPWDTWMAFLRHNDKEDAAKKNRGKGRRPRPGLPGLSERSDALSFPSPIISSAELMKEFRLMIKDLAPRGHTQEDLEAAAANKDTVALLAEALALGPRSVEAAFHCRLHPNVPVERRTLHELGGYYLPNSEGTFHRGLGLNLTSGQYTAPIAGFYELAATLHVALPEQRRRELLRPGDRLRLLICIQSQCRHKVSLEAVAGLQSCSELFTISVNGVLYLQMGQYTSVFLENASGSLVTVRSGSQFSAILLGI